MSASDSCQATAPLDRDRVLAAVRDELARWGIDRFDTATMVVRHGWDLAAVTEAWPSPDELILEALTTRPDDAPDAPDTVTEAWPSPDELILEALTTRPDDAPDAPDT
ncbi:hypothetical protein H5P33_29790, partial [Mycolicibacterium arabiense]|nr:hypothetical protein [Mycolicibacterium arabiense]